MSKKYLIVFVTKKPEEFDSIKSGHYVATEIPSVMKRDNDTMINLVAHNVAKALKRYV